MGASTNWQEDLKTAVINISGAGDNVLVEAPNTGSYLAIDFVQLIPTNAVTVTFYSGTVVEGQTAITGPYPLSQQQVVTDENVFQHQKGVMTCADARSFVINLGGAVQCGGFIRYRIVGNN
ncbi:MAG: hypothetical protein V4481_05315 [Patescibacteria group bacterium]